MLAYAFPLMLMGLAGMVNETLDRILLPRWLPVGFYPGRSSLTAVGIYGACYKLSIFMSLVIQAFRYAAEPFFFSQSTEKNSPATFALVLKWFTLCCAVIFVGISLNVEDFGALFLRRAEYREGLAVVPILLLANLFLGRVLQPLGVVQAHRQNLLRHLHRGRRGGADGGPQLPADSGVGLPGLRGGHAGVLFHDGRAVLAAGRAALPGALTPCARLGLWLALAVVLVALGWGRGSGWLAAAPPVAFGPDGVVWAGAVLGGAAAAGGVTLKNRNLHLRHDSNYSVWAARISSLGSLADAAETQPNFFSIAGIERRELPLSNTYAFFFRSDEPHGLGTLFCEALLGLLHQKVPSKPVPVLNGLVRVAREHPMDGGQWLDLLLHDGSVERPISRDATFAILVENKIDHGLHNNFTNYWKSVSVPGQLAVVLGCKREPLATPWVYVTHTELARAVEHRLGSVISKVHARYLPVLLHFLDYLKHMTDNNHDNFAVAFDFAQRNRNAMAEAQKIAKAINGQQMATAVAEAFGQNYCQRGWFDDRVDIQHTKRVDLRYVVFFRNVLDLSRNPGYAITLYAGGANPKQVAAWRDYLTGLSKKDATGISVLSWFPFNDLLVGKSYYPPVNVTLQELKEHISQSLKEDWQPLEPNWLDLAAPPLPEATEPAA